MGKFFSFLYYFTASFRRIKEQRMLSAILMMATGAGASRIVSVASIPVLTRIYEPEDFGVLSVFMALVFLLNPVVTLRYIVALPLPKSERHAFALLILCVLAALSNSLLVGGFLFFFGNQLFSTFSMQVLVSHWWLIVFGLIAVSLYDTLVAWATRKRAYASLAKSQIYQAISAEGVKISLGFLGVHPIGLLIGNSFGHFFGAIQLFRSFVKSLHALLPQLKLAHIKHVAYRYLGFPLYRMPAQVLLVFSVQAPTILAAILYDSTTLGFIGVAVLAIALPGLIIGAAVSKTVYGEMAVASMNGMFRVQITRYCVALFLISATAFLPAVLVVDVIVPIVFGESWADLSTFLKIFIVQVPFQLAASPFVEIFNFASRQHYELVFGVWRVLLLLGSFYICLFFSLPAVWFVALVAVCSVIYYSALIVFGLFVMSRMIAR